MTWQIRGLLGAVLAVVLSCGPGKDDAVRVKEGETLEGIDECPGLLCAGEQYFCTELLFEYGRSPPLCVTSDICNKLECLDSGKKCVLFDGIPVQLRCVNP
ncbi:hypothetical protein [Hyalangium versicolor]|uniref:hypothetical protein n=1 Tax=Hyalangium versicolor TaxID=2861190 RepID=UPI001CCB928F|nr:hypothetical protein [Hyalangium versicolor]